MGGRREQIKLRQFSVKRIFLLVCGGMAASMPVLCAFTGELCRAMDQMIIGSGEPARAADSETLFARIGCRLSRLYHIMQENRRKVEAKRQELLQPLFFAAFTGRRKCMMNREWAPASI